MEMESPYKKVSKVIVAGNGGIGKTTMMKRFCFDEYHEMESLTVGIEIFVKKVKINETIKFLQVWDLSGQNQFRFIFSEFIRGAIGAILGFEVKRRKSFLDLKEWIEMLREHDHDLPIVLIATKKDLGYHLTLNEKLAQELVEKYNLVSFIEVSSKDNFNIDVPFKLLIQHIEDCQAGSIDFFTPEMNR